MSFRPLLVALPESAHPLVYNSYLRSRWELSAAESELSKDEFCALHHRRLEALLASRPLALAIGADGSPDWVGGWLLAHASPERLVVHWIYVKHPFRRQGLASALLGGALARAGEPPEIASTYRVPRYRWCSDRRTGKRVREPLFTASWCDRLGARFATQEQAKGLTEAR